MGREDVPQSTKRSIEAERRWGEGKNAGRNAGWPKAAKQGDQSYGHEIAFGAVFVESWVQVIAPLKTCHAEELTHVQSIAVFSPHTEVVWKFRELGTTSGIVSGTVLVAVNAEKSKFLSEFVLQDYNNMIFCSRIEPISVQFLVNRSYGTTERRVLQLMLSWALTVHKMQSSIVYYAVIYIARKPPAARQAYVALSRVKSFDTELIEKPDCTKLTGKVPCNNEVLQEVDRMRTYLTPHQLHKLGTKK
ncbi:ATP-dependent DNA helicase [Trichonephila clavipes]|nr:ATP-dependent DNA helicase [Trichonephila clavipes]